MQKEGLWLGHFLACLLNLFWVCLHKAECLSPSTLVQPSFGFLQQQSLQFCSPSRWYILNSKFLRWSDNNKTEDEFFTMHFTTSEHDSSMSSGCLSGMHKEQIRCIPNLIKMGNDLILGPVGSGKKHHYWISLRRSAKTRIIILQAFSSTLMHAVWLPMMAYQIVETNFLSFTLSANTPS